MRESSLEEGSLLEEGKASTNEVNSVLDEGHDELDERRPYSDNGDESYAGDDECGDSDTVGSDRDEQNRF